MQRLHNVLLRKAIKKGGGGELQRLFPLKSPINCAFRSQKFGTEVRPDGWESLQETN